MLTYNFNTFSGAVTDRAMTTVASPTLAISTSEARVTVSTFAVIISALADFDPDSIRTSAVLTNAYGKRAFNQCLGLSCDSSFNAFYARVDA